MNELIKNEVVTLVRPRADLKETFLSALAEFKAEGLSWIMDLDEKRLREDFHSFVEAELNKTTYWTTSPPVPQTELWAVQDGVYVGRIAIRSRLNACLEVMGGHIGYDTRPSYRGRGIASEMLRQALPIAKGLGIDDALLTCNDDNTHSIRVIEKNGGRLVETKLQGGVGPLKRYYRIKL